MPLQRALAAIAFLLALLSHALAQDVPAEKPFVPSNRWALVIGASNYSKEVGPLRFTSKEAKDFSDELKSRLSFKPENVKLLADGGAAEEAPTSKNILQALDSVLANPRLDKANLFIFYFSGHGVATPKGDFLLPSDAKPGEFEQSGVPVQDVIGRIVKAGLKNVLFIADACRAGTANDFGNQFIELCRKANLAVILGCEPGKRSYEYPTLQSGAFTHFLIQSLGDPTLRDASGTLWASKLGSEVRKQVHDYTEPDYGKFAQNPILWGEQSTLDVLLATYPQKPVSDLAIQSFKKSAEKLNKREFAAAMIDYAAQLMNEDREDQSVELFKTVDQLGELTSAGRYLLGSALDTLGRRGEATRVFQAFDSEPDSYYKDLAMISSASRNISPDKRVATAFKMLKSDAGWAEKMLAWTVVHACGSFEQKLEFARAFASIPALDERTTLYAQAQLAISDGRWKDAVSLFRRSMKAAGDHPANKVLFFSILYPLVAARDEKGLEEWIAEGTKTPGCEVLSYLRRAYQAKVRGDQDVRLDSIRQLLKYNPDPEELWSAVKVAGATIGQVKDEFKAATARYPYSWRARVINAFLRQLEGDPKALDDVNKGSLYQEDALTFNAETFELMGSLLEEAFNLGRIKELDYRRQVDMYFITLLSLSEKFGYDSDIWEEFTRFGQFNERNPQVRWAFEKRLPFNLESVPTSLRPLLIMESMNRGDDDRTAKLSALPYEPVEMDDEKWLYACYLATRGKEKDAAKLVVGLRPASENIAPRAEAMKTYLVAKLGDPKEARKRLKINVDDLIVRGYKALAWAALGDWANAEPLLLEQARSRDWAFLYLSAKCMKVLDARYRATGRLAKHVI